MRLYRLGLCVCLSLTACGGTWLHVGTPPAANSATNQNSKSDQAVYSLDLQNPEITQKILPEDGDAAKARFVQVEIVEVTNPQKQPAQFRVHYQPNEGERILLGGFSLYPPDRPGKFIVPTGAKIKTEGTIVLSLAKPDRVAPEDVLKVSVKRMKLVG
jgi:hypothetical protein